MLLSALLLTFAHTIASSAHAAWAKIPILEVPDRIAGATIGSLGGIETLLILQGGRWQLVRWEHGAWKGYELELGSGTLSDIPASGFFEPPPRAKPPAGIGAQLKIDGDLPIVTVLVGGGTAARDGRLQVGDRITGVAQVPGVFIDTRGKSLEEVVQLIRGPLGSRVRLRTERPLGAAAPQLIELERATLKVLATTPQAPRQPMTIRSSFGVAIHKIPMSILAGRNDGINRLYIALPAGVRELTPAAGRWKIDSIAVEGVGTDGMQAARSRVDGRNHLYINRDFTPPTPPGDYGCISYKSQKMFDCEWHDKWTCRKISEPCAGAFIVNPPGNRDYDVLIGTGKILTRAKGGEWSQIGKHFSSGYLIPTPHAANTFYSASGLTRFQSDFKSALQGHQRSLAGNPVSAVYAQVEPKSKLRGFIGADDWHIYESHENGEMTDLGKARGVPWHLLSGDLRGTGFQHLYVTEERGGSFDGVGTTISEYTYYRTKNVAAVLRFDVAGKADSASPSMGGSILGDLLRSELLSFGHLDLIEMYHADQVRREREIQSASCADDACLARVGTLLQAQAVIKGSIEPEDSGYKVTVRVISVSNGRQLLRFARMAKTETDIFDTVRMLARSCALDWPHDLE